MKRDMPEVCDAPRCWARVDTWCPLCEGFFCAPHDAHHRCLGDDEEGPDE